MEKQLLSKKKNIYPKRLFFSQKGVWYSLWQRKKGEIMAEYEIMYDFDYLYKAHKKCRRGKANKKEVVEFELNLAEELSKLQDEIKNKSYKTGSYYKFTIFDPKKREIQALSYRDRIVQHNLCDNILSPIIEKHLIYDNSACRKNKGAHFSMNRLAEFKDYLKKCLETLQWHVGKELLLEFNNKTQLTTIKNGVDYLGFHFYLTDTGKVIKKLRTSSKKG